jgi:chromosome segregation ATPase
LQEDREEAEKVTRQAKERAEQAKKEAEASEKNLEILRPIMDSVRKEVKQFNGKIDTQLPPAGKFEGASSYRKKILPLFVEMKNKIAALGAELYQVMQELGQMKQKCITLKKEKKTLQDENARLLEKYERLQDKNIALEDRSIMLDHVVRVLGKEKVVEIIEKDKEAEQERLLESTRRKMWGTAEHNVFSPKKKTKSRGMER